MADLADDDSSEPLHVFDLPQLYTKPSAAALLDALDLLAIIPPSWDNPSDQPPNGYNGATRTPPKVHPEGITKYLTFILSSPLSWLATDALREQIWELASIRLSERSGRTAQPKMTRTFHLLNNLDIILHEPTLTSDNLGHKTWSASHLLARRLPSLLSYLPMPKLRTLELGAGTGLLGIAAACVLGTAVHLTDLPAILPNLAKNVDANKETIAGHGGSATTGVLDWALDEGPAEEKEKYQLILIADSVYSPEHPRLVTAVVGRWLRRDQLARVVVELPLREGYNFEIEGLWTGLKGVGLTCLEEGVESGRDDWGIGGGEVRCLWGVWGWKNESHDTEGPIESTP